MTPAHAIVATALPPTSPSGRSALGAGPGARVGHAFWMFGLPLTDEPDQGVQVVSAGGEEIASPLTDVVHENIDEHGSVLVIVHDASSSHSDSNGLRGKKPAATQALWGNLGRR